MDASADARLDRINPVAHFRLPAGVTPAYFDGFVLRNRTALVAVRDRQLAVRATSTPTGSRTAGNRYAEVYAEQPDLAGVLALIDDWRATQVELGVSWAPPGIDGRSPYGADRLSAPAQRRMLDVTVPGASRAPVLRFALAGVTIDGPDVISLDALADLMAVIHAC
jgi:hypothetical protein